MPSFAVSIAYLEFGTPIDLRSWLEVAQGAAILRASGFSVDVHLVKNLRQRDRLLEQWRESPPGLAFLPIAREQGGPAKVLLGCIQEGGPHIPVAVGGVIGTLATQEFSALAATAGIILGDWYEALDDLARALSERRSPEGVAGVWWRKDGQWELAPVRRRARTIGDLPEPALEVFRVKDLLKVTGGTLPIAASRGFPFRSLFSAEPLVRHLQEVENYYEMLAPSEVVRRARTLVEKFNPARFDFVDEIFPWNARWVERFATEWAQEVSVPFTCTMASEHFEEENVELLAGAGLKVARIMIESGNDQLRARFSDLNVTNGRVREAIGVANTCRMKVEAHLLLGVPDESPATLAETILFAERFPFTGIRPQIFVPWPRMAAWSDTDPMPTMATDFLCKPATERPELAAPLRATFDRLLELDSISRARLHTREPNAILDAVADFQTAHVRSPLARPTHITSFVAGDVEHPVIALRVPSEISWKVRLAADTAITFGILLEPTLPGLRSRVPVSFSVKVGQGGQFFRIFQKVLLQALDPDSRRWHFFTLPLRPAKPGEAEIVLESTIFGKAADELPTDGDLWAGWANVVVGSAHDLKGARDSGLVQVGDI